MNHRVVSTVAVFVVVVIAKENQFLVCTKNSGTFICASIGLFIIAHDTNKDDSQKRRRALAGRHDNGDSR